MADLSNCVSLRYSTSMAKKSRGHKWTDEQRAHLSDAARASWARRRAEAELAGEALVVNRKRGVPLSPDHRQKISESLRTTAERSPGVWAKSPEHREKIRQGKLKHEETFDCVECAINPCEQTTRHWSGICNSHRRMEYRSKVYGLTIQELVDVYERQSGKCAICPRDIKLTGHRAIVDTRWIGVVDHNHRTGVVRGLLCHPCNRALGMMLDSHEVLRRAITYLEEADSVSA